MKRTFAFGAATAQGPFPAQEDGYFVDPVRGFFALADGFGGRGAGDMAAKIALAEAARAAAWDGIFPAAAMALQKRNETRAPNARGGCSLVVAEFEGARLNVAHTGACAAGLVRAGRWRSLLLPQISLRAPYEAPLPDEALGLPGRSARIENRHAEVLSGDLLVLVSGGLDWESDTFQRALSDQLALRLPGDDLRPVAENLLASLLDLPEGPPAWNHSIVLVEKI